MNTTGICQECKKQFEYDLKPGFPRKYCFECGAIKKAQYENKPLNAPNAPAVPIEKISESKPTAQHEITISRVEKPNSYEFGVEGNRHKIYYDKVEELVIEIEKLKKVGLYQELNQFE